MKWGMIRADSKQPVINCRFEDLFKTRMFKDLLQDFRCIITINGYYEWKADGEDKQPFYLYPKEGEYLQLAGFFRPQRQADGSIVNSFVICTLEAMDNISFIHHRMPVILTPELQKLWLDPTVPFRTCFSKIYKASPKDMLEFYKVADVVNKIKNDSEDCVMKLEEYKKKLHSRGLGRFFGYAKKDKKEETKEVTEGKKEENGETQAGISTMPDKTTQDVTQVKKGVDNMKINDTAKALKGEEPAPEDVGVPLRLHKGKVQKKHPKFMTQKEKEAQAERNLRRSKRAKVQANKLDDMIVKNPKNS